MKFYVKLIPLFLVIYKIYGIATIAILTST